MVSLKRDLFGTLATHKVHPSSPDLLTKTSPHTATIPKLGSTMKKLRAFTH